MIANGVYRDNKIILVKPLTFMNCSGSIVPGLLKKYRTDKNDLVLVCDNMDLFPGVIRLKQNGGDAGHNGIKSVISSLGTAHFKRMYIGIGRPGDRTNIIRHVLGIPGSDDFRQILNAASIAAKSILDLAENSVEKVMNEINRIKNSSDNSCC